MRRMFVFAMASFTFFAAPSWAGPQEDATYIVEQTVTKSMFEAALEAQRPLIIPAMENQLAKKGVVFSDITGFANIFMEEFIDEFTEFMQRDTVGLYLAQFSPEELSEIAAFYSSTAGQALLRETPKLMQNAARIGQLAGIEAGRNAGPRVAARLQEEGITVENDKSLTQRLIDALK